MDFFDGTQGLLVSCFSLLWASVLLCSFFLSNQLHAPSGAHLGVPCLHALKNLIEQTVLQPTTNARPAVGLMSHIIGNQHHRSALRKPHRSDFERTKTQTTGALDLSMSTDQLMTVDPTVYGDSGGLLGFFGKPPPWSYGMFCTEQQNDRGFTGPESRTRGSLRSLVFVLFFFASQCMGSSLIFQWGTFIRSIT